VFRLEHESRMSHEEAGLYWLGLRADSDKSVFHTWARRLPDGMWDGHRSVVPSPEHLLFLGLTKKLVQSIFILLPKDARPTLSCSLRDALAHAGLPCTNVYNPAKKKTLVNGLGVSEWAAVLTVAPHACRRGLAGQLLRTASGDEDGACSSPLGEAVRLLQLLHDIVCVAFFYPRLELDGEAACLRRDEDTAAVTRGVSEFLAAFRAMCLRPDCAVILEVVDVPNIHRMSEVVQHTLPVMGHVRDTMEMLFEGTHKEAKHAIRTGNGRDDSLRAMTVMVDHEIISRIALDPTVFGVPRAWLEHRSLRHLFRQALPLWTMPSPFWTVGPRLDERVPTEASDVLSACLPPGSSVSWRLRCRRGTADKVAVGDAVAVLVVSDAGMDVVDVVRSGDERMPGVHVSFFRVVGLFTSPACCVGAVVRPFQAVDGAGFHAVDATRALLLRFGPSVRRALALHNCTDDCQATATGRVVHGDMNVWTLYGRRQGYPPRSG